MTLDEERIESILDKVDYVEDSLELLSEKQSIGREEYYSSVELKDVVERRFETMTQACIDIARMLLSSLDITPPESNAATMRHLADEGVLTDPTAERMAEACGFRNVLAHQYGREIEDKRVYEALQDLSRYQAFLIQVRDYVREKGLFDY